MSDENPVPATLESIAQQIRELTLRFDGVNQRFDGVNQRFDGVDQRFDGIDQRFDGIDRRLDGVDQRFDGIDKRLDGVDQRFDGIDKRLDGVDRQFDEVKAQLRMEIEAVRSDVKLVLEAVSAQDTRNARNDADHEGFKASLGNHDLRILRLEQKRRKA